MRVVIHPGFPKAASTTLQVHLFEKAAGVRFISPHDKIKLPGNQAETDEVCVRHLTRGRTSDDLDGCSPRAFAVDSVGEVPSGSLNSLSALCKKDGLNILSDEALLMPYRCDVPAASIPSRLGSMLRVEGVDVRVMIVIRNQVDLMYSFYAQKFPKLRADERFDTLSKYFFCSNGELLEGDQQSVFDFDLIVDSWERVFGQGSVSVVLFEDIDHRPGHFNAQLANLLGIKEPIVAEAMSPDRAQRVRARKDGSYEVSWSDPLPSFARSFVNLIRRISPPPLFRLLRSTGNSMRARQKVISGFSDQEKKKIIQRYEEGNQKLAERHGIDLLLLSRYGYLTN